MEKTHPDLPSQFDLLLMLDVLEHLRDPWAVLGKFIKMLKTDGTLCISIPNVANIGLIKNLVLHDRWQYSNFGLLDVTHLRFFTRTSFLSYVKKTHKDFELISQVINTHQSDSLVRIISKLILPRRLNAVCL